MPILDEQLREKLFDSYGSAKRLLAEGKDELYSGVLRMYKEGKDEVEVARFALAVSTQIDIMDEFVKKIWTEEALYDLGIERNQ